MAVTVPTQSPLAGMQWAHYVHPPSPDSPDGKFWRIRRADVHLERWWGRGGATALGGQRKLSTYKTPGGCKSAYDSLVRQKLGRGYQEGDLWRSPWQGEALRVAAVRSPPPPLMDNPRDIVARNDDYIQQRVAATLASAPPSRSASPPRRPHVDPLTGRVAIFALRDVYSGNRLVHARGTRQTVRPVDAAEICTGSLDYGYWHPDEPVPAESAEADAAATRVALAADRARRAALDRASSAVRATTQAFSSATEATREANRQMERMRMVINGGRPLGPVTFGFAPPPSPGTISTPPPMIAKDPDPAAEAPPTIPSTVALTMFDGLDDEEEI